jgi:hypothetical protein
MADAEIDWDGLVQCKESDLADLGMPKGARIKVRQALRDFGAAPGRAKGSRKGKGYQYSLTPANPAEEPPLPVGQGSSPTGNPAKAKMAHLQIGTPPDESDNSPDPGSPSYAMPTLDSLKSIWNTPTGVATPYGAGAQIGQVLAPYRQEASPALPGQGGDEADGHDGQNGEKAEGAAEGTEEPTLGSLALGGKGPTSTNPVPVPLASLTGEEKPRSKQLNANAREFVPASLSPSHQSNPSPINTPGHGSKQLNPKLQATTKLSQPPQISTAVLTPRSASTPSPSVPRTPPPHGLPPPAPGDSTRSPGLRSPVGPTYPPPPTPPGAKKGAAATQQ